MFGLHGLHSSVLHFSSLLIALFVSALLLKTSSVRGTWGIKVFFNPVNFYYIINNFSIDPHSFDTDLLLKIFLIDTF
jgi:hypothetical protein